MKTILNLLAIAFCAALVGCASGVNLNTPPLEDKPAVGVGGANSPASPESGAAASAGGAGNNLAAQNKVAPVTTDPAGGAAQVPTTLAKVIYFDLDSALIRPEFATTLEAHARWLNANRARRVSIEGHTDASGGREYNLALGQRRADAVSRALNLLGVSDQQMESVSFGKEKPADADTTDTAMAKNRRVEFFYR